MRLIEPFYRDFLYALRALRRNAGYTVLVLLSLALGIGANTAIFSVLHGVVQESLPYKDSERLISVKQRNSSQWGSFGNFSMVPFAAFEHWDKHAVSLEEMAAVVPYGLGYQFRTAEGTRRLNCLVVTHDFFSLLGIKPAFGRSFRPADDLPESEPVALLPYSFWSQSFSGDPSVVGKTLPGVSYPVRVVGILPPQISIKNLLGGGGDDYDSELVIVNLGRFYRELVQYEWTALVFGKLLPSHSLDQVREELNLLYQHLEKAKADPKGQITAVPIQEELVGPVKPALLMLFGSVSFLLLIASANVANVVLVRSLTREKELAIRAAIGAGRASVFRLLFAEGILVAVLGAGLGMMLAYWGVDLLLTLNPRTIPRLEEVEINRTVLLYTCVITLALGIGLSLSPYFFWRRLDLNSSLRETSSHPGYSARSLHQALVIVEIALAVLLAVGSSLLIRSQITLTGADPGFNAEDVFTEVFILDSPRYSQGRWEDRRQRLVSFFKQALERVEGVPGVAAASMGTLGFGPFQTQQVQDPLKGLTLEAGFRSIAPRYFRTLEIPLLAGRDFTGGDDYSAPAAAIINQKLAHSLFAHHNPLGREIVVTFNPTGKEEVRTRLKVIGVCGDVRHAGPDQPIRPEIYASILQQPPYFGFLFVRFSSDATPYPAVRAAIREIDIDIPVVGRPTRLFQLWARGLIAERKFYTVCLSIFAGVAFFLAAVGVFGIVSFGVKRRTHEIGVRMAFGAEEGNILRMILGKTMLLALVGLVAGLAGALSLTTFLKTLLFEIGPWDLLSFTQAAAASMIVCLLAGYIPARRALRVNPTDVLKSE